MRKATGEINRATGEGITIPLDVTGLKDLEGLGRRLGATTQFSATDALRGMKLLGASGWDSGKIKAGLEPILNLTGAAQVNSDIGIDQVSGEFSDVMGAYGVASEGVKDFGDQAAYAFSRSNQTLSELMEAMKIYAPTFKKLGVAKEDAMAMQMVLSDLGVKGNVAGTALAGFSSRMLKLPAEAANIIKSKMTPEEYGRFYDFEKDQVRDVMEMFRLMLEKGLSNEEITTVLGQESGKYMISLVNEQNINKVLERRKNLKNKDEWEGESKKLNDEFQKSFRGKMNALKSALSELAIAIGDSGLLDAVKFLTEAMAGVATAAGKIPRAVLGPLTVAFAGIASLVAGMATVNMAKRVIAFSGAFSRLGKVFDKVKPTKLKGAFSKFSLGKLLDLGYLASMFKLKNLLKPLGFLAKILRFSLTGILGTIAASFAYLGWFAYRNMDKIKKAIPWLNGFLGGVGSVFKSITESLSKVFEVLASWASGAGSMFKDLFLKLVGDPENKQGWQFNPFAVDPHETMKNANHNQQGKGEKEKAEISVKVDLKGLPKGSKLESKSKGANTKFDVYLGERGVAWS